MKTNPESGLLTARGDPPVTENIMDSGSKASSTKSGSIPESPGPSADVGHRVEPDEAHSHIEEEGLHEGSTEDKPAQAPPSFPAEGKDGGEPTKCVGDSPTD